jgi:hypothetical protein
MHKTFHNLKNYQFLCYSTQEYPPLLIIVAVKKPKTIEDCPLLLALLCYLDKTDDLARLADDLEILEPLQEERQVEGDNGQHVYDVHGPLVETYSL